MITCATLSPIWNTAPSHNSVLSMAFSAQESVLALYGGFLPGMGLVPSPLLVRRNTARLWRNSWPSVCGFGNRSAAHC